MSLYEELLRSCSEDLKTFFANVSVFENQFTWSGFSKSCYEHMYEKNSAGSIRTVKELKEDIPELKEMCKKCGEFFMPARNESIPEYDVIMGQQLEEALMKFFSEKLSAGTGRADLENRSLPDCKIMRPDGTAAAYFEVKFHGAPFVAAWRFTGRYCYEGSATLDHKKIEKQLQLIEELDAPVYYIHWIEYPCLKGVFYESSEQVKNYISSQHEVFERMEREGDKQKSSSAVYLKKMYSPLLEMKSFEQLMEEFRKLLDE